MDRALVWILGLITALIIGSTFWAMTIDDPVKRRMVLEVIAEVAESLADTVGNMDTGGFDD